MAGFVYLIGNSTFRWYKIGKSKTPEVRVQDLGVLLPFKIKVFGVWKAHDHTALERLLHEKYSEKRINGEWFEFNSATVAELFAYLPEEARVTDLRLSTFSNIEEDLRKGRKVLVRSQKKIKLTPEAHEQKKAESMALRAENRRLKESQLTFDY